MDIRLKGKIAEYVLRPARHRGRAGRYSGKIVNVVRTKRGIKSVTIARPGYGVGGFNWNGAKVRLIADEIKGVLYRGKLRPLADFEGGAI